jgi:hypothetical protein
MSINENDLAEEIRTAATSKLVVRQGVVMAANADGSCTVDLGKTGIPPYADARCINYYPVVGDSVICLKNGSDLLVIGGSNNGAGSASGRPWMRYKLTSTLANIPFPAIPGNYRNARLWWKGRGTDAATAVDLRGRINANTGVVYSVENETVDGASVTGANSSAASFKVGSLVAAGSSVNGSSGGIIEIPGYSDTVVGGVPILTRCVYSQVAGTTAKEEFDGSIYVAAPPTPVTQIDIFPSSGSFAVGFSCDLYLE